MTSLLLAVSYICLQNYGYMLHVECELWAPLSDLRTQNTEFYCVYIRLSFHFCILDLKPLSGKLALKPGNLPFGRKCETITTPLFRESCPAVIRLNSLQLRLLGLQGF